MRGLKSHTKGREHKKRDKNIIINRDRNHVSSSIDAYNLLRTHICIKRSGPGKPLHVQHARDQKSLTQLVQNLPVIKESPYSVKIDHITTMRVQRTRPRNTTRTIE